MLAQGADSKPSRVKEPISFGTLRAPSADEARAQALAWLKEGYVEAPGLLKAFEKIWAQAADRPLLDRVSEILTLDCEAKALLAEANNPTSPAPTGVPKILKDASKPAFYRANLALAYGKALSNRRIYEEALEVLKLVRVEDVVDPSAYLFHRAVAEHALLLKDDANRSILRLLDDTTDAPDRYKLVSVLMALDMQSWRDKDLGWIAREMDNIERRLELARGGPKTQKIQKEVVARLDELIKDLENQAKGNSNGGQCPGGGSPGPGGANPTAPQPDSFGGRNSGPGKIDQKKLETMAKEWGKLPPKKQVEAIQDLTRGMPAKYREVIEDYFRKVAASEAGK
jgi:hypothetical protein